MDEDNGIVGVLLANKSRLERFLRARLNDDAEAEDVLQELWIKVRTLQPGPIADPLAYLFRMTMNAALDRRRSARRRLAREDEWAGDGVWAVGSEHAPNAEHVLIARDELQRVDAALNALPDRTNRIFRTFRIEGASQRAIAAEHGISVSAVEKHLQRAYRSILGVRREADAEIMRP